MTTESLIDKLFENLDDWRNLPAYQLERRADIFFSLYLKEIIKWKYKDDCVVEIEDIIPEFPVKAGNLKRPNLSNKIDYFAVCHISKKVFLIELKTDNNSMSEKQIKYLEKAKQINITKLIEGILEIRKASKSKVKYDNLINRLSKIPWVDKDLAENSSSNYKIEILYIKPTFNEKTDKKEEVITFQNVIESLDDRNDKLTIRFKQSLENWKTNPSK